MEDEFKILIVNDIYTERIVLKELLINIFAVNNLRARVYTSSNGVEGIGYLLLIKPDIAIIDATLPEYSGVELMRQLNANQSRIEEFSKVKPIITSHHPEDLAESEFIAFSKKSKTYLNDLINFVRINLYQSRISSAQSSPPPQMQMTLTTIVLTYLGHRSNRFSHYAERAIRYESTFLFLKLLNYSIWFFWKSLASIFLTTFTLISGYTKDENISQDNEDKLNYRVTFYPSIFISLFAVTLIAIQFTGAGFGAYEAFRALTGTDIFNSITRNEVNIKIIVKNPQNLSVTQARVEIDNEVKFTDSRGEVTFGINLNEENQVSIAKNEIRTNITIDQNTNQREFTIILNIPN
jgi:CheY-like chemotaxis protein